MNKKPTITCGQGKVSNQKPLSETEIEELFLKGEECRYEAHKELEPMLEITHRDMKFLVQL